MGLRANLRRTKGIADAGSATSPLCGPNGKQYTPSPYVWRALIFLPMIPSAARLDLSHNTSADRGHVATYRRGWKFPARAVGRQATAGGWAL